jgi:uncharacterized tellurite resistance protein B-like protein
VSLSLLLPENVDTVIAEPLRFKQRLHIGRDAYEFLRAKDTAGLVAKAAGAAGLGGAAASSSLVAGTFFAPTGVLAWLGLATAATPLGWVVAASVVTGGLALGAMKLLDTDKHFVTEIPHFISTPLDVLATSLMNFIGRLAVRVALVDGTFDQSERDAIVDHFTAEWGFDRTYVERSLDLFVEHDIQLSIEGIAAELNEFQKANRDCNHLLMSQELMRFVREIVEADGVVRPEEREALAKLAAEFQGGPTLTARSRELGKRGLLLSKASATSTSDMLVALSTKLRDRVTSNT